MVMVIFLYILIFLRKRGSNSFRWMARVQYTLNSCEITTLHINHLLLNESSLISTFVTVCKTVSANA